MIVRAAAETLSLVHAHGAPSRWRAPPTTWATATCRSRSARAGCAYEHDHVLDDMVAELGLRGRDARRARSSPKAAPTVTAHEHDARSTGMSTGMTTDARAPATRPPTRRRSPSAAVALTRGCCSWSARRCRSAPSPTPGLESAVALGLGHRRGERRGAGCSACSSTRWRRSTCRSSRGCIAAWRADDRQRVDALDRAGCRLRAATRELRARTAQMGAALARALAARRPRPRPRPGAARAATSRWRRCSRSRPRATAIPTSSRAGRLRLRLGRDHGQRGRRLVPLGQSAGQRMLARRRRRDPRAPSSAALALADDELAATAPGLAIASALHETPVLAAVPVMTETP